MVAKFVVFVREACASEELQRSHLDIHILGSRSMMNALGLQQQGSSTAFHQSVCIISQSLCLAKVAIIGSSVSDCISTRSMHDTWQLVKALLTCMIAHM